MQDHLVICFCGNTGAGKTTLINYLISEYPKTFQKLISTTDRPMRSSESQGYPYIFISPSEFDEYIEKNMMIEYELQAHNNSRYGKNIEDIKKLDNNKIILTEIRVFKLQQLKDALPQYRIISVFIDTEDDVIEDRLIARGDTLDAIQNRINKEKDSEFQNKNITDFIIRSHHNEIERTAEQLINKLKETVKIQI